MDYLLIALLGLIFGSFTTVLIHRIPREIPLGFISHRRSLCPHCQKPIPILKNIPLLGYLFSRGKCVQCKKKISWVYPIVELLTALFFLVTYYVSVNSVNRSFDEVIFYLDLVKNLYFVVALIATVFIDLEFRIIPDRFSLGGWVVALGASAFWQSPDLIHSILGGLMGFGIFFLMAWGYERFKGIEGLGFGDVKMMGWLGSWLGVYSVPLVILIASVTGLIAGLLAMRGSKDGLKTAIPFGPFLAIGAYVVWVLVNLGVWQFG